MQSLSGLFFDLVLNEKNQPGDKANLIRALLHLSLCIEAIKVFNGIYPLRT